MAEGIPYDVLYAIVKPILPIDALKKKRKL
jgi:hypothetical protein